MNTQANQTAFSHRLIEALEFRGIREHEQQVKTLANVCGVTTKTASKYQWLERCPFNNYPFRLLKLADALNADAKWLFNGTGSTPLEMAAKNAS